MDPSYVPTSPLNTGQAAGPPPWELRGPLPLVPAGFWQRLLAVLIDGMILSVVTTPFAMILLFAAALSVAAGGGEEPGGWLLGLAYLGYYLFYFAISFAYFGWFYSKKGATPGKLIFKLRVHHAESGRYLGYWHAYGREVPGKILSTLTLGIGFLMAAFHPEKRALHDLLFKTRVVRLSE